MAVVGRVMVAAIVVAGVIVVGGSAQAVVVADRTSAVGQITSPPEGQVVSSASVLVSARTDALQFKMALYVEGPSTSRLIARGDNNQTLSGTFDAGRSPNGTYTVALKGEMAGRVHTTSTFRLRRPAASPSNVKAVLQGAKRIQVTWSKGVEPDLQSYVISATQSGMADRVAAGSACSGSSCRAVLAVPAKAAGRRVGFTVKAFRSDGEGGVVGSGSSGVAYVMVPASKVVQPVKSAKPKSEDTTRGSEALPTLPAKKQEKVVATPTRKQTAPASDDKLPAMPDTDRQGNLPIPTAETDPGSSDSLTPEGVKPGTEAAPVATHVTAQSAESPLGALGQYGLYIAGGIVLLLAAAHIGAWARRRALAAETGAGPPIVADAPSGDGPARMRGDSIRPTATTARRPAVVLAIAKSSDPLAPRAVHTEDRWDDYLPPSPRSMEDSGFWERPTGKAIELWDADRGGQPLRGYRGGES